MKKDIKVKNENIVRQKSPWIKRGIIFACSVVFVLICFFVVRYTVKKIQSKHVTISSIKSAWSDYDYQQVYDLSKIYLQSKPYNVTALTYYGYSCFFLAQSQADNQAVQNYLDETITSLRMVLYNANKSLVPQVYYMLGRAYFYKNTVSSHYYSDLAVKYFNLAKESGYESADIPEYLGLSYAALGMTMESIASFTESLLIRESDDLLLAIAQQYCKANEYIAAKQYLVRIINTSNNDELVSKSRILLGNIYIDEGSLSDALNEFNKVLEKNENSADAHYGIGVIYEKEENIVKARAEWRKVLKIQVNHPGAIQKLSIY